MEPEPFELMFFGNLAEDYIITPDGSVFDASLGGSAIHAAVGATHWNPSVGLVARVGRTFPDRWLKAMQQSGINTNGVRVLADEHETHTFHAYLSFEERVHANPAAHYLRVGHPLPKPLLRTHKPRNPSGHEEWNPLAIRPDDLPDDISSYIGAHLGPGDYLSHLTVPTRLRELKSTVISMAPSRDYMDPRLKSKLPIILSSLDAFLPNEEDARSLYDSERLDIWELAEGISEMGVPLVIIKCGADGQCLWDSVGRDRWIIPAYPARVVDVTGAGSAYCGGFLAGLVLTGDAVEAALRGSVSASLTVEGPGALFPLDAAPGFAQARLEAMRDVVKRV